MKLLRPHFFRTLATFLVMAPAALLAQQVSGFVEEASATRLVVAERESDELHVFRVGPDSTVMKVQDRTFADLKDGMIVQAHGEFLGDNLFQVRQFRHNTGATERTPHFRRESSLQGRLELSPDPPEMTVNEATIVLSGAPQASLVIIDIVGGEEVIIGSQALVNYNESDGGKVIQGAFTYPDRMRREGAEGESGPGSQSQMPSGPAVSVRGAVTGATRTTLTVRDEDGAVVLLGFAGYSDLKKVTPYQAADLKEGDVVQVEAATDDPSLVARGSIDPDAGAISARQIRRITEMSPNAGDRILENVIVGRITREGQRIFVVSGGNRFLIRDGLRVPTINMGRIRPLDMEAGSRVLINYDKVDETNVVRGLFYYPDPSKKN